ncbi:MAG: DUF5335 domain-containing protein [Acidocella sp.]|nr:DUF5335 domain-containing protein [Acidocella sp.]
MAAEKFEKAKWGPYFDRLSKKLTGQEAEVRVLSLGLGDQVEAEWVQIRGVTYDHKDDIVVISLEGIEHIIHQPKSIHIDAPEGGLAGFEVVDADGVKCVIQFREKLALPAPV